MEEMKALSVLVLVFLQLVCFVSCKPVETYNDTSEDRLVAMFKEKGYTLEEILNELKLLNKTSSIR